MNRLEHLDMVKPKNYEEYLKIHRVFELHNIKLLKSYERRVSDGESGYSYFPYLYWDRSESCLVGCRGVNSGLDGQYNELSLEEFLNKAGIKSLGSVYKVGHIKHIFI